MLFIGNIYCIKFGLRFYIIMFMFMYYYYEYLNHLDCFVPK